MGVRSAPCAGLSMILALATGHPGGAEAQERVPGGTYLGQTPPGPVAVVFAPGLVSGVGQRLHGAVAVSPDLKTVMWPVIPPAVQAMDLEDGRWSPVRTLEVQGRAVQAPAFSAEGDRLFYQAVVEGGAGGLDLWWAPREGAGWGAPVSVGAAVNTPRLESQPSLTTDGTLYFTGTLEGAGFDRGIYRARRVDGEYGEPELLAEAINTRFIDYCPWIAPDESYLLFASSRPWEEERLHLHVSFRGEDDRWSEPVNIHEAIGFPGEARFPSVSPDGRVLFFISGDSAYWVDMAPVLAMKPTSGGA